MEAIEEIKRKMCELAGYDYEDVLWSDGSHLKLKWAEEQENEFKVWFVQKCTTDSKFRREISKYDALVKSKKYAQKMADEFVFQYGFRTDRV